MNKNYSVLPIVIVFTVFILSACSNPIPEDKSDYAGLWEAPGMSLLILPDGSFEYERLQAGGRTSISGPIQEFDGDDFIVGIWLINTRFEVTEPPHIVNNEWQMVVDGVRLTKTQEAGNW